MRLCCVSAHDMRDSAEFVQYLCVRVFPQYVHHLKVIVLGYDFGRGFLCIIDTSYILPSRLLEHIGRIFGIRRPTILGRETLVYVRHNVSLLKIKICRRWLGMSYGRIPSHARLMPSAALTTPWRAAKKQLPWPPRHLEYGESERVLAAEREWSPQYSRRCTP